MPLLTPEADQGQQRVKWASRARWLLVLPVVGLVLVIASFWQPVGFRSGAFYWRLAGEYVAGGLPLPAGPRGPANYALGLPLETGGLPIAIESPTLQVATGWGCETVTLYGRESRISNKEVRTPQDPTGMPMGANQTGTGARWVLWTPKGCLSMEWFRH